MKEFLRLDQATKKILPLALSMGSTQLVMVASGFLCIIMLAHLGHDVLAASALIISTQMSVMLIGMSILFSLSLLIGHAYGAKNYALIGNFMQIGWAFAVLISLPIMLLFWFIGPILIFFGEPLPIVPIVVQFFHVYILGVIPVQWVICNQQLCYGTHQQRLAIAASYTGVVVLLITAYIFIFGKLGMPALGAAGFGYAMVAQVWSSLILMLVFFRRKSFKEFNLFSYRLHKSRAALRQMFKIGWPMSVQLSTEMLYFFVVSLMVGWIGASALAAYQVVSQCIFLTVIPVFALSQAIAIVVGQAKGAGEFHEIKNLGYAGLRIALIWSLLASLVFIFCPRWLASFYFNIQDPANAITLKWVIGLFLITAFSQTVDSTRNVMTGALRGLFDTRYAMYVAIIVLWLIALPLGYTLGFIADWGVLGIALGSATGMLVGTVLILSRWRKRVSSQL